MRFNCRVWLASFVMVCLSVGCGANHLTTTPATPMMSPLTPPPQPTPPAPVIVNGTKKSIRNWVTCDGVADDSLGVAQAFDAAKNNAFMLEVDCPVFMHVGMDTTRTVFIDNGTQVDFSAAGLIILDNILIPSFVGVIVGDSHTWRSLDRGIKPLYCLWLVVWCIFLWFEEPTRVADSEIEALLVFNGQRSRLSPARAEPSLRRSGAD
jgi:hypothetical protein